jgi:hypothetical protein
MSEINANFIVEQSAVNIQSDNNLITVDAEPISLNVFSLGFTSAGGQPGNLQFNDNGSLGGAANTVVSAGNVSFTNISNLKIANGSNGYFLQTDGTGNLTWAPGTVTANGNGTPVGANTQIQVTDGSGNFVSAPGFTFDNSTNVFTTPGNAVINGNVNATGNVTASYFIGNGSQLTGISGNVAVTNANSTSNTTYYPVFVSGIGNVEPQIDNFGNILAFIPNSGTLNTNILDIATIKNSNGNVNISNNVIVNANVTANYFIGNGSALTDITGANVTGQVANALIAGTVYTNAQPNITSVGTLSSLSVTGNISAGNVTGANLISANYLTGTLTTNAQPNITSVGILTNLTVNGNVTANYFNGDGGNISNIQSIANGVSSITIPTANGNIQVNPGGITNLVTFSNIGMRLFTDTIALGSSSAAGTRTIAIGLNALATNPSFDSIGIGANAGRVNQGNGAVAIGRFAGENNANANSISIGYFAGGGFANAGPGANAIAIGPAAGYNNQGVDTVAIGSEAGYLNQKDNSIAIGRQAGSSNLTSNSIAIGYRAAYGNNPIPNNSIFLNATGANFDGAFNNTWASANGFFVRPIKFAGYNYVLGYNDISGEISYYNTASTFDIGTSNITNANITNLTVSSSFTTSGNITSNNLVVNNFANVSGNLRSNNLTVNNFANVSGNINGNNISITNNLSAANISLVKYQETVIAGGNANGTITPNASAGTIYNYTLTGNITLNTLANAVAGTSMTLILTQDAVGNRLLSSTMKFAGNSRSLSTTANTTDIISVFYDGSIYYAALSKGYL